MRTYPKNTKELETKHSFSFSVDKTKLELIQNNVILRNDIAYVFLKSVSLWICHAQKLTDFIRLRIHTVRWRHDSVGESCFRG